MVMSKRSLPIMGILALVLFQSREMALGADTAREGESSSLPQDYSKSAQTNADAPTDLKGQPLAEV
jgi:hypothetical protein